MRKKSLLVVIAGVFILMCLGAIYSWGIFLVPIDRDTGWGRAQISFAVSLLLLVFSFCMVFAGWCERKIGSANTATLGGLALGVGWGLASLAKSPLQLYLFYGVLGGIGTGLSYMPSISSGIKWFPEKKGLVTGIIIFGFGFGSAGLAPLLTHFVDMYGWRMTMWVSGIVFSLIIMIFSRFLRNPEVVNPILKGSSGWGQIAWSTRNMVKTSVFWILFFTYFLAMVAGMMTMGHMIAFALDKQFSAMQGALALTVLSLGNGIGRIFFGFICDILGGRRTLIFLFAAIGVGVIGLYHSGDLLIYGFSALVGLAFGGFLVVYPSLCAEFFGQKNFAVNYGLIFVGYGLGCFTGPILGGLVYEITGHYQVAFYLAGALALLGAGVIWLCLPVSSILVCPNKKEMRISSSVCSEATV